MHKAKRTLVRGVYITVMAATVFNISLFGVLALPKVTSAADTGFQAPTSYSNSGWSNPANAYDSDNSRAVADSSSDVVQYYNFAFSIPNGSTIDGIAVSVEGYTNGSRQADISLSWNGGSNYTSGSGTGVKTTNMPGTTSSAEAVRLFGGVADTWNRTWTPSEFANFRVRLDATSGNGTDLYVDQVLVKVYYTEPVQNPALGQSCGLDVALVIDNSGSINSSELSQMRDAFKGFVDVFAGTPSQFSVTKFNNDATVVQAFTSDSTTAKNAIDNVATSSGETNWQEGLISAWSTFDPTGNPNLVLFASDGNPNRTSTNNNASLLEAVNAAAGEANTIKGAGTRIMALGIGDSLDVDSLKAISGPNVAPPATVDQNADVILADFSSLGAALSNLANQLCATPPNVSFTKTVDKATANEGDTLTYTITVSNTGDTGVSGIQVKDTLPANVTFVTGSSTVNAVADGTVPASNVLTWLVFVDGNSSTVITYQVKVNTGLPVGETKIENTAVMSCAGQQLAAESRYQSCDMAQASSDPAITTVTKQAPPPPAQTAPVLSLTKSVENTDLVPGDTVAFKIVVKNTGTGTAINVKLSDVMPVGFLFENGTNSMNHTFGNIDAGQEVSLSYLVTVDSAVTTGSYSNVATVTADNHGNVTASQTVNVHVPQVLGVETVQPQVLGAETLPTTGASIFAVFFGTLFGALGLAYAGRKIF